ncbi:hypothetical protein D3C75_1100720 [compost metagenome]
MAPLLAPLLAGRATALLPMAIMLMPLTLAAVALLPVFTNSRLSSVAANGRAPRSVAGSRQAPSCGSYGALHSTCWMSLASTFGATIARSKAATPAPARRRRPRASSEATTHLPMAAFQTMR